MAKSSQKLLSALIMLNGRQVRVYAMTTFADFMAMTGVSRDYISQTGYPPIAEQFASLPTNTLYWNDSTPEDKHKLSLVPETKIRYKSAKDMKEQHEASKREREKHREEYRAKMDREYEHAALKKQERIAEKLYEFDRGNIEWGAVEHATRQMYLDRARQIMEIK